MGINILYFGMLTEITGKAREVWPGKESMTVGELKEQLLEKYPEMQEKKFKVAVNQQIVVDDALIPFASEVALLPPFAGG
jgi:molybdopterin synthase sulfur carrier subunit